MMDKEKKLYCRSASEFTIEELEAKIGKIDNEYESKLFDAIKNESSYNGMDSLVWIIRELGIREANKNAIVDTIDSTGWLTDALFMEADSFNINGFSDDEVWNIIFSKCPLIIANYENVRALYNASRTIMYKIANGIIELGYIRIELGSLFEYDSDSLPKFFYDNCYDIDGYWQKNDGYETYDINMIESRYQEIKDFMRLKLTALQYDVFDYCLSNNLLYGDKGKMSDYEYKLAEEVQIVLNEHIEALFEIFVS